MSTKSKKSELIESCHEYLGCRNQNCLMFEDPREYYCWEVDETSCNHSGLRLLLNKMPLGTPKKEICQKSGCIYFTKALNLGIVK